MPSFFRKLKIRLLTCSNNTKIDDNLEDGNENPNELANEEQLANEVVGIKKSAPSKRNRKVGAMTNDEEKENVKQTLIDDMRNEHLKAYQYIIWI